ncbi:hypothetical protein [Prevotella sp. HUN102]|uniref:hypothetical protein n=1 Tax=Prevotella sp. HUN102 TaxID=1392486 RepID=UPI00056CD902|nr:hypothetical protein [Prevotella sp. HUN102]
MQQTIHFEPSAQARQPLDVLATTRRAIRQRLSTVSRHLNHWLRAESKTFTALCGERFTHGEVLLAHLFLIAMIAACGLAEWLEGGAL